MVYVALGCCLCLAFVFGWSAAHKLDPRVFAGSAGPLEILPPGLRLPAAVAVLAAEVTLTVVLLIGGFAPSSRVIATIGLLLAALLLLAFTAAIQLTLRRGIRKPCRCFGAAATPLGRAHLVRNLLLLATAVVGLLAEATRSAAAQPAGVAIAVVAGLVGGLLITRFDDLVDLFGSQAIS